MNNQIFQNQQFGIIRTERDEKGEPLFCLNDVCASLNLRQPSTVVQRLDKKGIVLTKTLTNGGQQQMLFINEPNLYRCIFQSKKKKARDFQDWIFNEVIPAIRKEGGYIQAQPQETPEQIMARALKIADQTIKRQQVKIIELENDKEKLGRWGNTLQQIVFDQEPVVNYAEDVLMSKNCLTSTQVAKDLGIRSARELHQKLKDLGILFYQSGQWMLIAKYANKGYTKTRTFSCIDEGTGERFTKMHLVWTEDGRKFLHSIFNPKHAKMANHTI